MDFYLHWLILLQIMLQTPYLGRVQLIKFFKRLSFQANSIMKYEFLHTLEYLPKSYGSKLFLPEFTAQNSKKSDERRVLLINFTLDVVCTYKMAYNYSKLAISQQASQHPEQYFYVMKLKKEKNYRYWNAKQNFLYVEYLKSNIETLKARNGKKQKNIFKELSQIIKTRTSKQVKSHHQKLLRQYTCITSIINQYQKSNKLQKRIFLHINALDCKHQNMLDKDTLICKKEQAQSDVSTEKPYLHGQPFNKLFLQDSVVSSIPFDFQNWELEL